MKLRRILLILVLKVLLISVTGQAQVYTSSDGYVEFISTAPLNELKGTSNHLAGLIDLNKNLVDFYVDLNTIDTGIEKRNRDMRTSYLNTDQYPFAEFTGELVSPFDPQNMDSQKVTVSGTFKLHGVERQIDVDGTLEPTKDGLQLDASWVILLKDYNIDRPGILFYELAEEQEINISILLTESETAEGN
ncbi:MAG: YceI family protein [Bacteroidetes bacterium]|jgi:polyisoprenoid-binding protein YceI|nr:YceI family protein [Bacteroidota bacterium]